MTPFYRLTVTRLRDQPLSMTDYADKVALMVNTANHYGFTPQYAGPEALYKEYTAQGLVMFGFPCNQFGKQEPDGAGKIEQTCHVSYGVSLPMFGKVDVNGSAAHLLSRYLRQALPGVLGGQIKWSFTKSLITRDGIPLMRFAPLTTPEKMEASIATALTR